MTDRLRDLPHMKQLSGGRQVLRGVLAVAAVARPFVRLSGRDLAAYDKKVSEWRQWERQALDLETVPDRFNALFGDRGWIMYEMINFDLAKACVAKAEAGDIDGAERDLVESITPDHIKWKLMLMRGIRAFEPRMTLAEKARTDYEEGRYYASVLVTLSLLDGLVNDLHHRQVGFFAKDVELNAWDSMSAHSTGLERLSRLLQERRDKTRSDPIALPYRHGIVHGRDLGYDNKTVAAKSWVALFAVRDWALKAEQKKLGPPPPQPRPSLWATLKRHAEWRKQNEALQVLLSAWRPRTVEVGRDCPSTADPADLPEGTPERAALEFFAFLRRGNYGGMVRSLDSSFAVNESVNKLAGTFRKRFVNTRVEEVRLLRIRDEAPAISVIGLQVRGQYHDEPFDHELELRLVFKGNEQDVLPPGAHGGTWRLVFMPALPTDPEDDDDV
jgi:hypothetical protein